MPNKPVVLAIMDGVGVSNETRGNAFALAKKPNLEKISRTYPGTALEAAGIAVGLPWGEIGSSEVGHLNIGAGLVVYQNYPRISLAIKDGSFLKMPIWKEAADHIQKNNSQIHLMGLLSVGGIHAHLEHLEALIKTFAGLKNRLFLHLFTDGEDSPPRSALKLLEKIGDASVATVNGRFYAMDRTANWDLTKATYFCLTDGQGETADSAQIAIQNAYQNGLEDETIKPTVIIDKNRQPLAAIKEGDALIFFNIRPDRARQLTEMFLPWKNLLLITMTEYSETYPVKVAFPPKYIRNPLSRVLADAGKNQLKISESEKRAHATYFFNGGQETAFENEERIILPSAGGDYEVNPEMSAYQITDIALNYIGQKKHDLIVINFANGDMLGHTGNLEATAKAITVLDECLGKIAEKTLAVSGALIITADHGNAEEMVNLSNGEIDKEHSTNPVPCWILTGQKTGFSNAGKTEPIIPGGILADIAPTILELLNLSKPPEMDGGSLVNLQTKLII